MMILRIPLLVAFAMMVYAVVRDDESITLLAFAFLSGSLVTGACIAWFERRRKKVTHE